MLDGEECCQIYMCADLGVWDKIDALLLSWAFQPCVRQCFKIFGFSQFHT